MAPTKITILYKNLVSASMITLDNDEDTNFPVTNAVDGSVSVVSRTTDVDTAYTYSVDLGAGNTEVWDTFALAGHNFSSSAGLYYFGDDTTSPPSVDDISSLMTDTNLIYYRSGGETTNRYITFIVYWAGNPDGYHEIGEFWIGHSSELDRNPQIPIGLIRNKNKIEKQIGGGQHTSFDTYQDKGYNMQFIHNVTSEQFASMDAINNDRKQNKSFFLDLAPTDDTQSVLFVRTTNFNFKIDGKNKRPGTWSVIEDR